MSCVLKWVTPAFTLKQASLSPVVRLPLPPLPDNCPTTAPLLFPPYERPRTPVFKDRAKESRRLPMKFRMKYRITSGVVIFFHSSFVICHCLSLLLPTTFRRHSERRFPRHSQHQFSGLLPQNKPRCQALSPNPTLLPLTTARPQPLTLLPLNHPPPKPGIASGSFHTQDSEFQTTIALWHPPNVVCWHGVPERDYILSPAVERFGSQFANAPAVLHLHLYVPPERSGLNLPRRESPVFRQSPDFCATAAVGILTIEFRLHL